MAAEEAIDVLGLVRSEIGFNTNQCMTCNWVADRPEGEQKAWDEVLGDRKRYPHAAIHRAILKADPECRVGRGSIENHRANRHRS